MTLKLSKRNLKEILGGIPLTAELYSAMLQPGKPLSKSFSLQRVKKALPAWREQVELAQKQLTEINGQRKKVLVFCTLRSWIQHGALLAMTLAGLGHEVTLAFLPYANWRKKTNRFDLRRQNKYALDTLAEAEPFIQVTSFFEPIPSRWQENTLPQTLLEQVDAVTVRDVQYGLQIEEFSLADPASKASRLFRLRQERNREAAQAGYAWMQENQPDLVITANGSILEMGVIYQVAKQLGIPVVTYEFGEQRQRIWLARDAEVMQQDTSALWQARGNFDLDEGQSSRIQQLFRSRQKADLWNNFARRWQGVPSQGGESTRRALGLDQRPIVLLAANVIGDSLTLGRQKFSQSMTEWLQRTVEYFSQRADLQLVIRIHPGERFTQGPSVAEVVRQAFPQMPEQIHIVSADASVNSYDLFEIACLGLVYTTTAGLEMAMSGVPVVVAGATHYRGKGFTRDPESWEEYFSLLETLTEKGSQATLEQEQVELAWRYAYRFFFEYPLPFPWHLHVFHLKELDEWPVRRVLSEEGQAYFGETFRCLLGEPRNWRQEPVRIPEFEAGMVA